MSRLAQLARPQTAGTSGSSSPDPEIERCELCGATLPPEHRHLVDLQAQRILCGCRACTLLFDRPAAGGDHYRLIPDRGLVVDGFELSAADWDAMRIPVGLAFFFQSTAAGRTVAFYPSPLGATECLLELEAWAEISRQNPVLAEVESDVEAVLINRTDHGRGAYVVPIDRCYALVGLIRIAWKGLNGGDRVWAEIDQFFTDLRRDAKTVSHLGKDA